MHCTSLYGWMTCDFTSFSTVLQSYQDDGRVIKNAWCIIALDDRVVHDAPFKIRCEDTSSQLKVVGLVTIILKYRTHTTPRVSILHLVIEILAFTIDLLRA